MSNAGKCPEGMDMCIATPTQLLSICLGRIDDQQTGRGVWTAIVQAHLV
jgi:hypothetical protein